ncbi:hypothetical protein [Subtercola boreus]|uniref:Asp23/Gls24 family envelope stress response protein n=1 Tax=Subtercola boreus TaxID=120213 RepID=A0A3E0W8I7_9MICO|nr:hypothetical protein [Subtercola boreus]RFA18113.1 hypothetical protein B7R24_15825 [Subtercola boreus]RFA18495.1 hypothetical protein B7R23_15860 [Subtercola boreus]RFA25023.1 hypothetical protein B7R25_15855 [Subtercola boreus]
MTDITPEPSNTSPLDETSLDGHTIDELSDYLDRGRLPRDPSIESSAAAQHALAALSRLRAVAPRIIRADAAYFAPKNENWMSRILDQIGVQAHAGRDIPIPYDVPGADLSISEGAVRALVRAAGDDTDGLVVERTQLDGDLETPGAPVEVHVIVSTFADADDARVVPGFRRLVIDTIREHTDLVVTRVTVRVHDSDITDEDLDDDGNLVPR